MNPLPTRVKPLVIKTFLTFDSMDITFKCDLLHCKAVEQYSTVELFVFRCGKFINFGLALLRVKVLRQVVK